MQNLDYSINAYQDYLCFIQITLNSENGVGFFRVLIQRYRLFHLCGSTLNTSMTAGSNPGFLKGKGGQ